MRERLRNYSLILQLDTQTLLAYKLAPDGLVRALQMFFIVSLIAGLGIWLGIPVQLDRPVLYEVFNDAQEVISDVSRTVEPFVAQSLPFLETPQDVAEPIGKAAVAAGESVNELLLAAETEADLVSPPLGPQLSRVIHLFGRWVSVPFAIMAEAIFFVLVAMVVAKTLGGRATLGQHLTAVLLSSAPVVLLLGTFIPDLTSVMPITFAAAITLFSRVIAVVSFAWITLILIKSLALAHEFSYWRALGILLLSGFVITILLPASMILLGGYLLRF